MIHNSNNKYIITDTSTSVFFVVMFNGQYRHVPNDRYLSNIYSNRINKVAHTMPNVSKWQAKLKQDS